MPIQYVPIEQELLAESDDRQLFQNVADHFLAVADDDFGKVNLVTGSEPARYVWCLWMFFSEVASSGINVYLWNHCYRLDELQETYAALIAVGASEVRELLEGTIAYSLPGRKSEFLNDLGAIEWAAQFQLDDSWNPEAVDSVSMEAVERANQPIANYIRRNASKL